MTAKPKFDAFLSYSHDDRAIVEQLARKLKDEAKLTVWLDEWNLVAGTEWRQAMARGLDQAACCVVCVGDKTPRGWFNQEIGRALDRQVHGKPPYRVIPLLLPGAKEKFVDDFLELRTWVDMRGGLADANAMRRLARGIQGLPPGPDV